MNESSAPLNRRALFRMIGAAAGSAVMYQAMSELGYAAEAIADLRDRKVVA